MISIIIPVYNEENILISNSAKLSDLSRKAELIFVDGGSTDRSIEIARQYGVVLESKKGRAVQMNYGAQQARNDILFFLHADNVISRETLSNIEEIMCKDTFIGGCLSQRIDNKRPIFRLIEAQGNIRARVSKVFYGDQGIFVRKDIFSQTGGFPEVPIFEDVLFTRKLKGAGKTAVLADKIIVSPRRWQKRGIIKTTIMFTRLSAMFRMGFPLERIKRLYEDLR